ncbi:hypothetical protein LTS18_011833, partial [Coniosporium uncinatum]
MWAVHLPEDERRRRQQGNYSDNPWHHDRGDVERAASISSGAEVSPEGSTKLESRESRDYDVFRSTWGERDTGIEDHRTAMEDFETLRKELSGLSRTRSRTEPRRDGNQLQRIISGRSMPRTESRRSQRQQSTLLDRQRTRESVESQDLEAAEPAEDGENEDDFQLEGFMREGHFEK